MTIKHLQHVGKRALPWLIITLAALIALPQPAQAAPGDLVFTIEAPGVQVSQVTCETPTVETFDQAAPGFAPSLSVPIGEYAAGSAQFEIRAADLFGGAGGSGQYISTEIEGSYTLTLLQPAGYFGFWWSAGNGNNRLIVTMNDGTTQTFSTQSILDSGELIDLPWVSDGGHLGNPNPGFEQPEAEEYYAYVNIFATDEDSKIVSLKFLEESGTTGAFESDNHTVCPELLSTDGTPIPQEGSITIVKEAIPESEQEFEFLTNIGGSGSSFTLKDNGSDPNSITFNNLLPFNYDVTEQVPAGWSLDTIVCRGGSDIVIVEASANVQINLGGSEDVICTFVNVIPPPPLCDGFEDAVEVNFNDQDAGTNISTQQPYADLFGPGSGIMFSHNTSRPLTLYDTEGVGGEDPDLERNNTASSPFPPAPATPIPGYWSQGNLGSTSVGNGLIIHTNPNDAATNPISMPNDWAPPQGQIGDITIMSDLLLANFAFDFIDFENCDEGDVVVENSLTGQSATISFCAFEANSGLPSANPGVEFGDRAGNRITDVAKSGAVIGFLFDKITYQLGGSGSVGAICLDKTDQTVPVTLGWFLAEANGDRVDFRWQTTTETANAGFNLYGEGPDGLIRLNDALIPSSVIDSVEPTDYAYSAVTTATVFYVEELSLEGMTDQIGPFELGREYGVYVATAEEIAPKVWLPIMVR